MLMLKKALICSSALLMSMGAFANSFVEMQTNMGNIEIELFDQQAPVSVKNFEAYAKSHFYDGTIFHRVIPGFMIQGGGMTAALQEKPTRAAIRNEASNGLKNTRGTIAMARTNDPNSATSQFFINVADNAFLNAAPGNAGYAVFGKVVKGMDVVDKIAGVSTTRSGQHQNLPKQTVKILNVQLIPSK